MESILKKISACTGLETGKRGQYVVFLLKENNESKIVIRISEHSSNIDNPHLNIVNKFITDFRTYLEVEIEIIGGGFIEHAQSAITFGGTNPLYSDKEDRQQTGLILKEFFKKDVVIETEEKTKERNKMYKLTYR